MASTKQAEPVQCLVPGTNADLIQEVARLYLKPTDLVADLTYGRGVFWKQTPWANVIGSDLMTVPERPWDFSATPHTDSSFDVVVLDPPYAHTGKNNGQVMTKGQYRLDTIASFNHEQVMASYRRGLDECVRIVKPGGLIWVKCKDEVESGRQRWSHIRILEMAEQRGLYGRDLFVLNPSGRMVESRWATQKHGRKNLSYLWVFQLPRPRRSSPEASVTPAQESAPLLA